MAEAVEYGLSATGFRRKRLPEILQGLNDRVSDKLGIPIQTGANSVFGQIHGVYANALAELWELAEKIYFAMYPSTADGVSLSNAAALAGIAQIEAEQTTLIATCYGNEGAVVPYGAQIGSSADTSQIFSCVESEKTISANRACEVHLTIPTVASGTAYKINLDGVSASRTATNTDTDVAILTDLAEQFEFDDKTVEVVDNELVITSEDEFSLSTSTLTISKLGSPFKFECVNYGAINPAIGSVDQIITNSSGWLEVSNNMAANVARDAETDTELRQRWSRSVYGRGAAMTDSIAAAIYQRCKGVTLVRVYENLSDLTDEYGRPPHSIEAVVDGGDPQEICDVILEEKAAGIDTYGSISRMSDDIQGISHPICFNRPEETKIWLKIEISTEDKEDLETFTGLQNIKQAILEKAEEFSIGDDVILQKFYGAVYENSSGVGYVTIKAAAGETASGYTSKNVRIDVRHYATFDESRIEVAEV